MTSVNTTNSASNSISNAVQKAFQQKAAADANKPSETDWSNVDIRLNLNTSKTIENSMSYDMKMIVQKLIADREYDSKISEIDISKLSIEELALLVTNIGIATFSSQAEKAVLSMKIESQAQKHMKDDELEKAEKQRRKAIRQAKKSDTGSIIKAVVDWAISLAEVAYGLLKLGQAVVAKDAVSGAAGAAYLTAGLAGMVKATAETLIILEIGNKKKLKEVAEIAGKVQLALEIVASSIDMFQAGRAVYAARAATKGTQTAMKEAAPQIATQVNKAAAGEISKEAAKAATKELAEEVGQRVAQETVEKLLKEMPQKVIQKMAVDMSQQVAKEAGKEAVEITSKEVAEAYLKESIKRTVQQAIEKNVDVALKKGAQVTAEQLSKGVVSSVSNEMLKTSLRATISSILPAVQSGGQGAQSIATGTIELKRAELEKQIEELQSEQDFLQWCFQWFEQMKNDQRKTLKNAYERHGEVIESGSTVLNESTAISNQIAANIV